MVYALQSVQIGVQQALLIWTIHALRVISFSMDPFQILYWGNNPYSSGMLTDLIPPMPASALGTECTHPAISANF